MENQSINLIHWYLGNLINKQSNVKEYVVKYLHSQIIIFMKDSVKMSKKGMDMADKYIVMAIIT